MEMVIVDGVYLPIKHPVVLLAAVKQKMADYGPGSLLLAERIRLAKGDVTAAHSIIRYPKEFDISIIGKCGHVTLTHVNKSDVRHKRWSRMIQDGCRALCASCIARKEEDYAPILAIEEAAAEHLQTLRHEVWDLIKIGKETTLVAAVESVTGDPEERREVFNICSSWYRQYVKDFSPRTDAGRKRIASLDAELSEGYEWLRRRAPDWQPPKRVPAPSTWAHPVTPPVDHGRCPDVYDPPEVWEEIDRIQREESARDPRNIAQRLRCEEKVRELAAESPLFAGILKWINKRDGMIEPLAPPVVKQV
jgi:hypothetical protein